MNELERLVWATAFASMAMKHHGDSGFTAGEWANDAVDKLRDALACEDHEYLYPVKEGWAAACRHDEPEKGND
jgi:hypothetical protein